MAHLSISELVNFADSFYIGLLGVDVYLKWKKIRNIINCETEQMFVNWMLDVCEKHLDTSQDKGASVIAPTLPSFLKDNSRLAINSSNLEDLPSRSTDRNIDDDNDAIGPSKILDDVDVRTPDEINVDILSTNGEMTTVFNDGGNAEQIIFIDDEEEDVDSTLALQTRIMKKNNASRLSLNDDLSNEEESTVSTSAIDLFPERDDDDEDDKLFRCDMCCGKFKTASNLKRHKICSHLNVKQVYKCAHCEASFTTTHDRLAHEEVAHDAKVSRCNECNKKFRSRFSLRQHVERVHRGKRKHLRCSMCEKRFSYHMTLDSHVKTVHMGIKNHECRVCGKRFGKHYELYYHINSKH